MPDGEWNRPLSTSRNIQVRFLKYWIILKVITRTINETCKNFEHCVSPNSFFSLIGLSWQGLTKINECMWCMCESLSACACVHARIITKCNYSVVKYSLFDWDYLFPCAPEKVPLRSCKHVSTTQRKVGYEDFLVFLYFVYSRPTFSRLTTDTWV